MTTTTQVELPSKSSKLKQAEREAAEAHQALRTFIAETADPSGNEVQRPAAAKTARETARRLQSEAEGSANLAHDLGKSEGWERADRLLRSPGFRAIVEAKVSSDSERMEPCAALLNVMNAAGQDAIIIAPKVPVVSEADELALRSFAHRFKAQMPPLDLKILTPAVRAWVEGHTS